jgi:hypothetical protein
VKATELRLKPYSLEEQTQKVSGTMLTTLYTSPIK